MILIGSGALNFYLEERIVPRDIDLVGTYEEVEELVKKLSPATCYPINSGSSMFMRLKDGTIIEVEIAWEGSRAEKLIKFIDKQRWFGWSEIVQVLNFHCRLPALDVLYMLKMSHRYLKDSPHFLKTMKDIRKMREMGCTILPEWQEFYEERMRDTYTYNHPSLKVGKGEFFDSEKTGVVQKYDHDSIHEAVAHLDKPAYTYFTTGEVWSDMNIFETLPERVKLLAVLEESLVLAAERSQLAFPECKIDLNWSFNKALEKVCTSITSGRFREYSWDNYDKVQEMYSEIGKDYMDRIYAGIASGLVRKNGG